MITGSRVWLPHQLPKRKIWTARQIQDEAKKRAGKGLEACARFYLDLLRQAISVQAPYIVYFSKTGKPIFRALTKATPGAPPRRVSGNLLRRTAIDYRQAEHVAFVFTDVGYGAHHERKNHKWFVPTLLKNLKMLGIVAGGAIRAEVGTL